jgi:hypothetical protein
MESPLSQTFQKTAGGGGFPFTQWGGGDRRYLNVFPVSFALKSFHDFYEVDSGKPA